MGSILRRTKAKGPSDFALSEMGLFLGLTDMLSTIIIVCDVEVKDLQWLQTCRQLEELHLGRIHGEEADYVSIITGLPNLRSLSIYGGELRCIAWIANCRQLRELDVRCIGSSTTHLESIAELGYLVCLSLHYCEDEVVLTEWLIHCRALRSLVIHFSCACPFTHILEIPTLERLELRFEMPVEPPALSMRFFASGTMKDLNLSRSRIRSINWLVMCPFLSVLSLSDCSWIIDFSPVGQLHVLEKLSLEHTCVEDLTWITGCLNLLYLSVYGCLKLNDLGPVRALTKLEYLNMRHIATRTLLPQCRALKNLEVCCSVDVHYESLSAFNNLRMLTLILVNNVEINLGALVVSCTQLERLHLSCDCVTDASPLSQLEHLRFLNIQRTNITSIVCLAACPALEVLYINLRWITDSQCIELFPSIIYLYVGKDATEEALQEIGQSLPYVVVRR